MFLSSDEAQHIAEMILAKSSADGCIVKIEGGEDHSLRFARGGATTNLTTSEARVKISSHVGGRIGSATTTSLEPEVLHATRVRSEEIARLLPIDPDYTPPLGPQDYSVANRYHDDAAALTLETLAGLAAHAIEEGAHAGVDTFGCANGARRFEALATSAGLCVYERRTEIDLSVTARNRTDNWSGWAGAHEYAAPRLNARDVARRACMKAARNEEPIDLEPGSWPVILEPEATAELAFWTIAAMDARAADEGRSFYARPGGGTRIGEAVFDPRVTIRLDPADPLAPEGAVGWEGVPHRARAFVDRGVVSTLYRSRAWAQKTNAEPIPFGRNFVMEGGDVPLDEMIRATKRGVLVTRLWYTNMVEPKSLLLTGLTRDGNFLIENGRIVAPARNMRFNQRLGDLFGQIAAMGPTTRTWRAAGDGAPAAPAIMIDSFSFTSKSSGI